MNTLFHTLLATLLAGLPACNMRSGDPGGAGQASVAALAERARDALCPAMVPDAYSVAHVDSGPAVVAGRWKGYRIVISKLVRMNLPAPDPRPTQAPPFINVTEFAEIVLVPLSQQPPAHLAGDIPWCDFTSMYHVQAVDMGEGFGYRWFGRMNLWEQDDLRERLGLAGGDDRRALAEQGLAVEDKGNMTRNSMQSRLDRFGLQEGPG